jgi:hypothetical protein
MVKLVGKDVKASQSKQLGSLTLWLGELDEEAPPADVDVR